MAFTISGFQHEVEGFSMPYGLDQGMFLASSSSGVAKEFFRDIIFQSSREN